MSFYYKVNIRSFFIFFNCNFLFKKIKIMNRNYYKKIFFKFNIYFFYNGIQLFIFLYFEVNYVYDIGQKMENIWNDISCDDMLVGFRRFRGFNFTYGSEILQ